MPTQGIEAALCPRERYQPRARRGHARADAITPRESVDDDPSSVDLSRSADEKRTDDPDRVGPGNTHRVELSPGDGDLGRGRELDLGLHE